MINVYYTYTDTKLLNSFKEFVVSKDKAKYVKACCSNGIIIVATSNKNVGVAVCKINDKKDKPLCAVKTKKLAVLSFLDVDGDELDVNYNGKNLTYKEKELSVICNSYCLDEYVYSVAGNETEISTVFIT